MESKELLMNIRISWGNENNYSHFFQINEITFWKTSFLIINEKKFPIIFSQLYSGKYLIHKYPQSNDCNKHNLVKIQYNIIIRID